MLLLLCSAISIIVALSNPKLCLAAVLPPNSVLLLESDRQMIYISDPTAGVSMTVSAVAVFLHSLVLTSCRLQNSVKKNMGSTVQGAYGSFSGHMTSQLTSATRKLNATG